MRVLTARGTELERDFPFALVRQLFEPALHALTPPERDELLAGAAAPAGPVVGIEPADGESQVGPLKLGAAPASEAGEPLARRLSARTSVFAVADGGQREPTRVSVQRPPFPRRSLLFDR